MRSALEEIDEPDSKRALLEETHQALMAFRTDHGDNLEKIPQKANARVLGPLDVLAGQIVRSSA